MAGSLDAFSSQVKPLMKKDDLLMILQRLPKTHVPGKSDGRRGLVRRFAGASMACTPVMRTANTVVAALSLEV